MLSQPPDELVKNNMLSVAVKSIRMPGIIAQIINMHSVAMKSINSWNYSSVHKDAPCSSGAYKDV